MSDMPGISGGQGCASNTRTSRHVRALYFNSLNQGVFGEACAFPQKRSQYGILAKRPAKSPPNLNFSVSKELKNRMETSPDSSDTEDMAAQLKTWLQFSNCNFLLAFASSCWTCCSYHVQKW